MRIIVFFDLPSVTHVEKKNYLKFRKYLLAEGFIMMQESVYSKLALNGTAADLVKNRIYKETPGSGIVQVLVITEMQYSNIEYVCGESQKKIIDSEERLIII